ncbi:MAG: B12-binding domain-containing radical SAM protein [Syntrophus sp. (in: bacteria)]|nr:B12-binding domain-containing radical SAM protein [Syntrophus sp. (in: bacteria)]
MKKLLLINPVGQRSGSLLSKFSTFQPLSLAYTAAVTPSRWEIKIVDENIDEFKFEEADLVGITAFTSNINRAYEIAQMYQKKKIKVIMGGIHISMLPDEALQYADTVVTGEVEGIWNQVITDFENNHLLPRYKGPRIDLSRTKITPRHDLLHPSYFWNSVQTSRGCPFNCNFCSVSRYLGKEYRQRRAKDVLDELEKIKGKYITFIDDNLIGHSPESRNRAMELFEGMIGLNLRKKWWMQSSMNAADDEHLIELAAQAGCMYVFIGFETLNKKTLEGMKKGINLKIGVENYKRVVDRFHKYGIGVLGSFVIGNDHESPEYYKGLADFLVTSGIDIVQINILTPLPGTDLMEQMQKEGRLIYQDLPKDWYKYRFSYVVHQIRGGEENTVYTGNNYIKNKIYSFPFYQYRLLNSIYHIKNPTNIYAIYKLNQSMKKGWQGTHYYKSLMPSRKTTCP